MARTLRSDKVLFGVTLLLVGVSVLMVFSASAVTAMERYEVPAYFLRRQLAWIAIGLVCFLTVMRIDYREYSRPAVIWTLLGVTAALLLAVFFFEARNGTRRWLLFGPVSFQPSELAKLAAILFAAALLERRMHRVDDVPYALAPILIVTGGLATLILTEPDFGTAAMVVVGVAAIVFAAGLSWRYVAGAALVLLPAAFILIVTSPYRLRRVLAFLNPWEDVQDANYQIFQALIAFGSGGIFGRGFMEGGQKLFFLPEAHTDFIYAVVGEELGLLGTLLILACFALIAWRGLRAALLAPDRFGALLAVGLTTMVAVQGFVNMSVNVGLLPTKGIPLPFVSNGGSSLLVNLVAMGILLNISQRSSPATAVATEARG